MAAGMLITKPNFSTVTKVTASARPPKLIIKYKVTMRLYNKKNDQKFDQYPGYFHNECFVLRAIVYTTPINKKALSG